MNAENRNTSGDGDTLAVTHVQPSGPPDRADRFRFRTGLETLRRDLIQSSSDSERMNIRTDVQALEAAVAKYEDLRELQVELSILVCDVERAIVAANPAPSPQESGRWKGMVGGHTLPPGLTADALRQMRSVHNRLPDQQYAEICENTRGKMEPLSRRALKRALRSARAEESPPSDGSIPGVDSPLERSATFEIEESVRRSAAGIVRRHQVVAVAVVVITDPGAEPTIVSCGAGTWELSASFEPMAGAGSQQVPKAPDEEAVYWAAVMELAGEWMRRRRPPAAREGLPRPPLTEPEARNRARGIFKAEFGHWPDEEKYSFRPGTGRPIQAIRDRARAHLGTFVEQQRRMQAIRQTTEKAAAVPDEADEAASVVVGTGQEAVPAMARGWKDGPVQGREGSSSLMPRHHPRVALTDENLDPDYDDRYVHPGNVSPGW